MAGENRFLIKQVDALQQFIAAALQGKKIKVFSEVDKMPDKETNSLPLCMLLS